MKHIGEYRDADLARGLAAAIAATLRPDRRYHLMEFCGGHTHAIARHGIADMLPPAIRLIHGPGCPVCVLPAGRVDDSIRLAQNPGVTLCTYADLMRVPGTGGQTLLRAKAAGADVRMVYSSLDAVRIAEAEPGRTVVFVAIGFETTTPPTAIALRAAEAKRLRNFLVFCNHVLTPVAMRAILEEPETAIDGFIGPAHVSTVIGLEPYGSIARDFRKPVVVAGFEPLDVMQAVLMLVRQLNGGRAEVENEYARAVRPEGNRAAQDLCADAFAVRDSFEWRGLGAVPRSALRLSAHYAAFDAEARFALNSAPGRDNPACECPAILRGRKTPSDCKLFGTTCTPETPLGACMVSSEGACAAHYSYGRQRMRVA